MAIRAPITRVSEVRCSHCRVSFPPEVKRCIHCGERTHAPGAEPTVEMLHEISLAGADDGTGRPIEAAEPPDLGHEEGEVPKRSPLRMVSALVWIVLAIGGALYRACGSGA